MRTPSHLTVHRIALAAMMLVAVSLIAHTGPPPFATTFTTMFLRPLEKMIRYAPPQSRARRPVEPLKRFPLPAGLWREMGGNWMTQPGAWCKSGQKRTATRPGTTQSYC